jgi:adenosine deaminase
MEAVIEGKVSAELKLGIIPRIIVSGMRQLPSSITTQLAEIAWRYRDSGVVGFDLAGPEDGFSSKLHKEAFQLVHENLLNCTLHSGEAASWESVSDSIQYCGAQRIGHGVRLIENKHLTQYVADRRIAIEICLTYV